MRGGGQQKKILYPPLLPSESDHTLAEGREMLNTNGVPSMSMYFGSLESIQDAGVSF